MKMVKHFALEIEPAQSIQVPFNSEVLRLDTWFGKPTLYFLIDTSYTTLKRTFHIFDEEKEIPARFNRTNYVGSFEYKIDIGPRMLHVFEE